MNVKYVLKNRIYRCVAALFDIFTVPFGLVRRTVWKPGIVRNILVVRLDHMGDFIFTTPLFRRLKERYPRASLTLLVSDRVRDIAVGNPCVDKIITYKAPWFDRDNKRPFEFRGFFKLILVLRKEKYDLGLDPRGDLRHIILMALSGVRCRIGYGITGGGFLLHRVAKYEPERHQIEHNLNVLNALLPRPPDECAERRSGNGRGHKPELFLSQNDIEFAERSFDYAGIKADDHVTVIHPFAGYPSKRWPQEKFSALIKKLVAIYKTKVIIIGASLEASAADGIIRSAGVLAVNIAGKATITEAAAVIKKANLFIGLDSGPAHMAAALECPLVVLYSGTNDHAIWGPRSDKCIIVRKDVPCMGCERTSCDNALCMNGITVDDVMEAVNKAMSQRDKSEIRMTSNSKQQN